MRRGCTTDVCPAALRPTSCAGRDAHAPSNSSEHKYIYRYMYINTHKHI